ncbi:MAG: hypothetical protein H6849_02410 [Alphaproteobacteria bacterium]|nr:MAG: hypothetical protein H6849_02410 [Alphaproteobacteria bacterium]
MKTLLRHCALFFSVVTIAVASSSSQSVGRESFPQVSRSFLGESGLYFLDRRDFLPTNSGGDHLTPLIEQTPWVCYESESSSDGFCRFYSGDERADSQTPDNPLPDVVPWNLPCMMVDESIVQSPVVCLGASSTTWRATDPEKDRRCPRSSHEREDADTPPLEILRPDWSCVLRRDSPSSDWGQVAPGRVSRCGTPELLQRLSSDFRPLELLGTQGPTTSPVPHSDGERLDAFYGCVGRGQE